MMCDDTSSLTENKLKVNSNTTTDIPILVEGKLL